MKLIKFFGVMALAVSTTAFAAPVCNDITTFPTMEKVVSGKTYQIPKCVATCLQVTPYTKPRCVDYDNVLALRPRNTDINVKTLPDTKEAMAAMPGVYVPPGAMSSPIGAVVPNAGPISCLDTTTFPQVSKGGLTFPVCIAECAKSTFVTAPGTITKMSKNIVVSIAAAATIKPKMIVTGDWITANTKVVSVNDIVDDVDNKLVIVSISTFGPPDVNGAPAPALTENLTFTTPSVGPPVCVGFAMVAP